MEDTVIVMKGHRVHTSSSTRQLPLDVVLIANSGPFNQAHGQFLNIL